MRESKRIKDPIYGYIEIPLNYMNEIVDTASFQRLRRIIQTSYSPLYSSAVHNRFVHSMGVYHLGELVAEQLGNEIEDKGIATEIQFDLKHYGELFKLACLLHDVGHAPFSHTGEGFYLDGVRGYDNLHSKLADVIGSEVFSQNIPRDTSLAAAPHEIMSAIIGIIQYQKFINSVEDKEFFARCITGYQYQDGSVDCCIKNCYISMLNSKVIDVDKLDYLIRDAYVTGFDTVNIDFERLLSSLTVSMNKTKNRYEIAYYKNAVSVIENVVYAHDAERKWIQTHPVVLYETYIMQHIMAYLSEKLDTEEHRLFSMESLSEEGHIVRDGVNISLLCDDDIIFLIKNVYKNPLGKELFERRERKHPVWKSEAEYKAFLLGLVKGGELLQELESAMSVTAKYLVKNTEAWVIDDTLISKLEKEIEDIEKMEMEVSTKRIQLKDKKKILSVVNSLKQHAEKKNMECNFVILMASQFNSGFGKADFPAINIAFKTKEGEKLKKFGDIASSIVGKERERDSFFYLFYKREPQESEEKKEIDNQEICKQLVRDVGMAMDE